MKIAVIIPDRNDRHKFLQNCLRMLNSQTLKPSHIEIVNDVNNDKQVDISYRYRVGYDRLRNKGFDLIALIENDDWYSNDYLKIMSNKWIELNKPNIIGTNYSIYYHLITKGIHRLTHTHRSAAMNTLLKPDLTFSWCRDSEPYTDLHLWSTLNGITFAPEKIISLGIKHGVGLCGGAFHTDRLNRYEVIPDFLKNTVDKESFEFYDKYFEDEI